MKRLSARKIEQAMAAADEAAERSKPDICPLCDRPIPPHGKSSRHHLVPRLKGGTHMGTVRLHQICLSAIHARFSETQLAVALHDIAALRSDADMAGFIAWVKTKPPGFHAPTRLTKSRRETRARH